jgi:hypothetical protein
VFSSGFFTALDAQAIILNDSQPFMLQPACPGTPQTISAIGGYRVQGRQQEAAD